MKKLIIILFLCSLTVFSQEDIECKKKITELNLKIDSLEKRIKTLEVTMNNLKKINYKKPNSKSSSLTNYYISPTKKKRKSGRTYHRGSRGGCYYYNSKGNKQYVPRSLCN